GIIIVDFIDMTENENRKKILDAMKEYAAKDSISTNVIDFTKLNLMEITRKKTRDMVKVRDNIF
ncbi:MAG: ribonuclease E/G, partial [Lachnospiraceae bacterium]